MRIVRFIDGKGTVHFGLDTDGKRAEVLEGDLFGELTPSGETRAIRELLTPVSPPNVFGIGLNYREHARQMGVELPKHPVAFMKPTTALLPDGYPIQLPALMLDGPEVDYEAELAVVIGKTAKSVSVRDALSYVLGYTVANDVSARNWSSRVSRTRGKIFDGFCPLGPVLVTADEIPDPQSLDLTTSVNGKTLQQGNTGDMIFSVAELISELSQDVTLLPGTVILTGTPPGSGMSHNPPIFLSDGDAVEVSIEGIGVLRNLVVAPNTFTRSKVA